MPAGKDAAGHADVAPDDELIAVAARAPAARRATLAENVLAFCGLLREAGLPVTTGRVVDAARALERVDVLRRDDMQAALAATLVSERAQRPLFDELFELFWSAMPPPEPVPFPDLAEVGGSRTQQPPRPRRLLRPLSGDLYGGDPEAPQGRPQAYSEADVVGQKDFSALRGEELPRVRRLIRELAPKLRSAVSRRHRAGPRGHVIDLRRSLRRAARRDGEVREIVRRRRRHRRTDVVLLADVSGSMDRYSEFLVQFIYGLQQELRGVSTFVFSTRLFEVTLMLRAHTFGAALRLIERSVDAWSGGTRIGEALALFNRRYARDRVHRRTVVIVLSDGWDRGDAALLGLEMEKLQRRAKRLIWLNPLLGHPQYQPLSEGMAAALPFCDDFLPAHNVESLKDFGRHLLTLTAD